MDFNLQEMKQIIFKLILFLNVLLLSYCKINSRKEDVKNNIIFKPNLKTHYNCFIDSTIISKGKNTLKIISCFIDDSVHFSEQSLFKPIFISQMIYLLENDTVIYSSPYNVKIIYQKDYNGNIMPMLENVICEIGIIGDEPNILYSISGYGGCSSCTELNELLDRNGKIVWRSLYSKSEETQEIGDLKQVLKIHNVPDTIYRRGHYIKKRISSRMN